MSKIAKPASKYPMTDLLAEIVNKLQKNSPLNPDQTARIANSLRAQVLVRVQQLEDRINGAHYFSEASKRTGLPPSAFFLLAVIGMIVAFGLAIRRAGGLVSNVVGVLFPIYASLRTIENKDPEEITRWISYWAFYGLITVLDTARVSSALTTKYKTLWNMSKIGALYWLQSSKNSTLCYKAIRPSLISAKILPAGTSAARPVSTSGATSPTGGFQQPIQPYSVGGLVK
ncbi:hypothetical protein SmJEL517_g03616 [Synchytrium microbalum]|uniref:Protein YOP1 n=1 Tax=Synchytrium microbalum TaxID=1806994 RepID=A0A507C221_9FUNG|nr:uncharacterized protein SmJEL517_g03616 [Synchytrium microbalum]TPX33471.1 hypothetical protein SmJEL517_g03616 [Synchytrium microbalum]